MVAVTLFKLLVLLVMFCSVTFVASENLLGNHNNDRNAIIEPVNDKTQETDYAKPTRLRRSVNGQPCQAYQFYCGRQLAAMGYLNTATDSLYECTNDNEAMYFQKCPNGCVLTDGQPQCKCQIGVKYCGYEMRKYNFRLPYNSDHNLYVCQTTTTARKVDTCTSTCMANNNGDSQCRFGVASSCESGALYCGLELTAKRFTSNWGPNLLYQCSQDGERASLITWCRNGCIAAGMSHCNDGPMPVLPADQY